MGGRLNLDGGTLNFDEETLTLDGGTRYPASPYNLSTASTSPVFTRQNTFEKKELEEMLIEQTIEFQSRGPGRPGGTCTRIIS